MKPRLSQLVADTAAALSLDERSVSVCARHLRAAGLIQKKGRGNSAAIMTPTDATNLIFGVMASNRLQDAPANVRRVRDAFIVSIANNFGRELDRLPNYPFLKDDNGRIRSLGRAFDALIEQIMKGDGLINSAGKSVLMFWLRIDRPGALSHLEFSDGLRTETIHFIGAERLGGKTVSRKAKRDESSAMTISATITLLEIEKIAACLRGKKQAAKLNAAQLSDD